MQNIILKSTKHYIIQIQRGEDVIKQLAKFCDENNINSGSLHGIGACDKTELGAYSVNKKEYDKKEFKGEHEITSLVGVVSNKKIHAHATIADSQFQTHGGHINSMRVSATCEIHLIAGEKSIPRKHDEETGLELLHI